MSGSARATLPPGWTSTAGSRSAPSPAAVRSRVPSMLAPPRARHDARAGSPPCAPRSTSSPPLSRSMTSRWQSSTHAATHWRRELAALPSPDAVAAAIGAVGISHTLREGAARDHERALSEARVGRRRGARHRRRAARARRRAQPPRAPGACRLDALGEATAQLLGIVPGLRRAWARAAAQASTVGALEARLTEARRRAAATASSASRRARRGGSPQRGARAREAASERRARS